MLPRTHFGEGIGSILQNATDQTGVREKQSITCQHECMYYHHR
jgi:hypothetical protein